MGRSSLALKLMDENRDFACGVDPVRVLKGGTAVPVCTCATVNSNLNSPSELPSQVARPPGEGPAARVTAVPLPTGPVVSGLPGDLAASGSCNGHRREIGRHAPIPGLWPAKGVLLVWALS